MCEQLQPLCFLVGEREGAHVRVQVILAEGSVPPGGRWQLRSCVFLSPIVGVWKSSPRRAEVWRSSTWCPVKSPTTVGHFPPPHTPGCSKDFINVLLGIIICFGETFHGKTLVCVVLRSSNHFSTDADVCSSNCSIVYACVAIMKRDIHFSVFLISFSKLKYFSTQ